MSVEVLAPCSYNHAGLVTRKRQPAPGPSGWGLGVGLTIYGLEYNVKLMSWENVPAHSPLEKQHLVT